MIAYIADTAHYNEVHSRVARVDESLKISARCIRDCTMHGWVLQSAECYSGADWESPSKMQSRPATNGAKLFDD